MSIDRNIESRFGAFGDHDWAWRKMRHVDDDFAAPNGRVAVAEDEAGAFAGYVTMRLDREAGVGTIPNLAVRADLRGKGLGRRLIEHALGVFREEGLKIARIETLEQNEIGRHLYPQLGFVEVARQLHFAMRLDGAQAL
ncbi:MAG: hypothetical protein CMJ18_22845 [Phycisphaeraceae bacterium]|nr:hypothetical protein [Phycisphaeraceae bacterium]